MNAWLGTGRSFFQGKGWARPIGRRSHLGQAERYMRTARALLSDPDSAADVPIACAILPVAGDRRGWGVKVQIAVDPDRLYSVPMGGTTKGNWEVGALLADADAKNTWEMLAISEVRRSGGTGSSVVILHERTFDGLRPGRDELRAFLRDRWANLYGGGVAAIDLPDPTRAVLAGPVVRRADSPYLPTSLPLRQRGSEDPTAVKVAVAGGSLPLTARAVTPGEPLEFVSWLCPGKTKDAIPATDR